MFYQIKRLMWRKPTCIQDLAMSPGLVWCVVNKGVEEIKLGREIGTKYGRDLNAKMKIIGFVQ